MLHIVRYKIIWDFPTKLTIPCSTVAVKAHRNKANGTSRRNSPLLEHFRGRRQKKVCRQSRDFHNVKGPQIANQMGLANQARLHSYSVWIIKSIFICPLPFHEKK